MNFFGSLDSGFLIPFGIVTFLFCCLSLSRCFPLALISVDNDPQISCYLGIWVGKCSPVCLLVYVELMVGVPSIVEICTDKSFRWIIALVCGLHLPFIALCLEIIVLRRCSRRRESDYLTSDQFCEYKSQMKI